MTDGLIVWAALGPVLAFVAGAIAAACWDDDEEEDLLLPDYLRRADTAPSSFDLYRRTGARPLPGAAVGIDAGRPARSCLQCGRREEWP